jgi:hypothetical protein
MDTTFGFRGTITPADILRGHKESFTTGHFQISIEDGVYEIGYEDETLADDAKEVAARYIAAYSFNRDRSFELDLNQSWRKNTDGTKSIAISLTDRVHITDELGIMTTSVTIAGKASIVKAFDSRDFDNETELVRKSFSDPALAKALQYFSEEVVGDDRPLYGVYKALEALTEALGSNGRERLAGLVGQSKEYVSDIMQTAQTVRHHADPNARPVISERECRNRAKALILAYSRTVK